MPPRIPTLPNLPTFPSLPSLPALPNVRPVPAMPDWRGALETGMQYTELRRSQARELASDLVAQGHQARDQVATAIDELIDSSRRRREELRKVVQLEFRRQLGAIGLATKSDLAALERRMTKALREQKKAAAKTSEKKDSLKSTSVKREQQVG